MLTAPSPPGWHRQDRARHHLSHCSWWGVSDSGDRAEPISGLQEAPPPPAYWPYDKLPRLIAPRAASVNEGAVMAQQGKGPAVGGTALSPFHSIRRRTRGDPRHPVSQFYRAST